jgi:hypothetical protein
VTKTYQAIGQEGTPVGREKEGSPAGEVTHPNTLLGELTHPDTLLGELTGKEPSLLVDLPGKKERMAAVEQKWLEWLHLGPRRAWALPGLTPEPPRENGPPRASQGPVTMGTVQFLPCPAVYLLRDPVGLSEGVYSSMQDPLVPGQQAMFGCTVLTTRSCQGEWAQLDGPTEKIYLAKLQMATDSWGRDHACWQVVGYATGYMPSDCFELADRVTTAAIDRELEEAFRSIS